MKIKLKLQNSIITNNINKLLKHLWIVLTINKSLFKISGLVSINLLFLSYKISRLNEDNVWGVFLLTLIVEFSISLIHFSCIIDKWLFLNNNRNKDENGIVFVNPLIFT